MDDALIKEMVRARYGGIAAASEESCCAPAASSCCLSPFSGWRVGEPTVISAG